MTENYHFFPITPMGAPRMTRADAWRDREVVLRYRAFKDEVRLRRVTVENGDSITFYLPMPPSWSKKKMMAMAGEPHQQKPDIDNILKALLDAIYAEDCHVWCLGRLEKRWGSQGMIVIEREKK